MYQMCKKPYFKKSCKHSNERVCNRVCRTEKIVAAIGADLCIFRLVPCPEDAFGQAHRR